MLPGIGGCLEWECSRGGFELRRLPGRTHVKAILVDDRSLVLGSSNFDFLSYRLLDEILAIVQEPRIIDDFVRRVASVDVARSHVVPCRPGWGGLLRRWCLAAASGAVVLFSGT